MLDAILCTLSDEGCSMHSSASFLSSLVSVCCLILKLGSPIFTDMEDVISLCALNVIFIDANNNNSKHHYVTEHFDEAKAE